MRAQRGSCRWLAAGGGLLLSLVSGQAAQALTLSLVTVPPTPGTVTPGAPIFVQIQASGLTSPGAPSITAFDLDLAFDDSRVDFVGLTFDPLGMTTCTPATQTPECDAYADSTSSTGFVNLAVSSLLDPATINANQPASGPLATLHFLATGVGTASFSFTGVDVAGTIDGTTEGTLSATTVGLDVVIVPEPGTACLILLGLSALSFLRKSSRA
jgi:hypothetical protein